ncbi:CRISPR-associated endonuclease Cas2 [Lapidilactobacillus achengensis]|uniref:CRISPR-associated endoribonuclease Cas2 n=1 Tax=Lapidilactobacillus achengensis TaxID=2486000 RepID=A0ABW1UKA2_9LACO|nr:CRISPR-associated endonuclease Cas2 [Lapidilactobacillus achengensis]
MLVVVAYDVSLADKNGVRRLRRVAKKCEAYGQRVQNSVFECYLDYDNYVKLKVELLALIDQKVDSLKFYQLGKNYANKIETFGAKQVFDLHKDTLIF